MREILSELNFDLDALRKKYKEERERRIRSEGSGQYQKVEGEFSFYLDDPWAEPGYHREPIVDDVDVLVVGIGASIGQTQNSRYGRLSYVFHQILADWRASGDFPGMEIVGRE